jgi:ATP phosphoribosyltransferase
MELTIAIAKGRLMKEFQQKIYSFSNLKKEDFDTRKLIIDDSDNKIKYIILKPSDVPVYVDKGIADLGIVGKDVLMEMESDLYEVMNFDFGKCRFAIAGIGGKENIEKDGLIKVATKYPNITQKYFEKRGKNIEIIKLNGSVELAPLVGLSDVIVDIVETGNTLKANGLSIIEDMYDISAKMVSNKLSYRMKYQKINDILKKING